LLKFFIANCSQTAPNSPQETTKAMSNPMSYTTLPSNKSPAHIENL